MLTRTGVVDRIVEIFGKIQYITIMTVAKPFIKWVGGKSQLIEEIREKYPSKIEKYCEPFVGGGAVLFDVLSHYQPKTVLINDINKELINTYAQIKNNCPEMITQLSKLQNIYKNHSLEENKVFFYEKRTRYNELKINGNEAENLEKAVLFIFLNKTCFNGLYRVSMKKLLSILTLLIVRLHKQQHLHLIQKTAFQIKNKLSLELLLQIFPIRVLRLLQVILIQKMQMKLIIFLTTCIHILK